ncbi:MAG: proton-conducting transporter membrane subunit, partial [Chloroflexota bacterium]
LTADWTTMFGALSLVTMTLGNIVAVQQQNIKRMMGYSSIAQAGYLMIGLAVAPQGGVNGIIFFLVSYAVTNLGAFIAIIAITEHAGSEDIQDFGGVFHRSPLLALGLALCMLSLTGIPPTAGFFGKLFLFGAGVQNGLTGVVLVGVVNSVVSAYYYLGVVKALFVRPSGQDVGITITPSLGLAFGVAVAGTLVLGFLPGPVLNAATAAARGIFP